METDKRPCEMTPHELAAVPVKSPREGHHLSPYGLAGDDLIGYWRDRDGKWWQDPAWCW